MANITTLIEEWEIRIPELTPIFMPGLISELAPVPEPIRILVTHHTEMGNLALPGIQVHCADSSIDYEPVLTEYWAYSARRLGKTEYLLEYLSWKEHADTYIKFFLLIGNSLKDTLKARVAVKVNNHENPIIREYELPFTLAAYTRPIRSI